MFRTANKQDVRKRSITLYKDEKLISKNDDDGIDDLKEDIITLSKKLREKENEAKKIKKIWLNFLLIYFRKELLMLIVIL